MNAGSFWHDRRISSLDRRTGSGSRWWTGERDRRSTRTDRRGADSDRRSGQADRRQIVDIRFGEEGRRRSSSDRRRYQLNWDL